MYDVNVLAGKLELLYYPETRGSREKNERCNCRVIAKYHSRMAKIKKTENAGAIPQNENKHKTIKETTHQNRRVTGFENNNFLAVMADK